MPTLRSCGNDNPSKNFVDYVYRKGLGSNNTIDFFGWDQTTGYEGVAGQSTDPGALSTGYSWNDIWKKGVNSGFSILQNRFGGMQPGTYYQSGNNVAYRVPTNQTSIGVNSIPGIGFDNSGSLLMLGGLAVGALVLIKVLKG